MCETLTIENFGPIKKMHLKLRVANILIGDQGTGKSTVAKLLSVIKETCIFPEKDLKINGKTASEERKMNDFLIEFKDHLEIYSINNYLKADSFIEFSDSVSYLKYENQKIIVKKATKPSGNKHTDLVSYIPAYREAAMLLKDSLNAIAAVGTPLPKLFYYFGQNVINAKKAKSLYNYSKILDVKYKYVGDNDIVILKSGQEIVIEEASSAINSGIPLLIVFDNAVESNYPTNGRMYHHLNCPYIIIEEPELNCFPMTQKKMMEHFISKIKYEISSKSDYYCRLVITTHSPYILTSLNNMMYAFQIGKNNAKATEKNIKKKYWMNPADVSAYMLLPNGECENIIDNEGLIKAEKIDSVSSILNKDFNALMDIELNIKE